MDKVILESKESENFIIDNAYKHFSKEKKNPLTIKENTEVIEEGIKYFKTSPRLYKLALKLEKKSQKFNEETKEFKTMNELVMKINALANNLELLEDKYYLGNKKQKLMVKAEYQSTLKQYNSIIKMMRRSEVIDALKTTGSLACTVASMALPYIAMSKFLPNLMSVNAIGEEADTMKKAWLYCKRAGAFTLFGLPIKATRAGINALTSDAETKILAKTDSLLKTSDIDTKGYDEDELHQLS
jgi:hypothetical protein